MIRVTSSFDRQHSFPEGESWQFSSSKGNLEILDKDDKLIAEFSVWISVEKVTVAA